ncbi:PREDICTED: microtubule-associated protein 10 [Ceratotherium simum simum]|uniref:Microtubule-associated protein 10 n=1 Tax=Ceratotherium simum simum TaxID=73337 RepID=A0ABM0HRH1_CERSS|nr:PREDICTED: microtubule-associated protein 10 [Ceratotherium simum simum]
MAAASSERLFSLELLVDWVRLEAGLLPPPPPVVAVEEEQEEAEEEEEQEASPPRPSRGLCPAVAFRLLDFPTLLVYPPGGPAAPAPEPRPGLVRFGRGKSCLFRLHRATLHRLLLQTPLYTLLLQLPPGRPTPAPRLLGSCSISLAAAARKVLGPAASGCSQGHRGSFPLHNQVGERIGDIALGYRLTDLGSRLLGHLERPVACTEGGVEPVEVRKAVEISSQTLQEEQQLQQPNSEPSPRDADGPRVSLKIPKAEKGSKEMAFHSKTNCDNTGSVENGKTNPVCSNAVGVRSISPQNPEVTELDIETNTFCPPPLYYTHPTLEKTPPVQGKITIKPQMNVPEELDGTFPEEKLVNPPTHTDTLKHRNSATLESPPMLINLPHAQEVGASNQATDHPQTEENRINTIRQLPLLNALLIELSLLYNQPVASPTHIHPHLAWLYRTEVKSPESSAISTCKSESKKDKLSMGENEKSVSLQYKKNQVENLKKGKYFDKNSGTPPKRVPRGKLLYGLTNTLKLRLKQTNPDMLVVHEKREKYRKMQAQMLGAKLRIPSSKVKVLSFAEQREKPHQLPKDKCLALDASFAENSDTSKQISGVFDNPSTTKEIKLKCTTEKTVDCGENTANNGSLEEILSSANFIVPERFTHTNILGGKVEMKVPSPCFFRQVAVVDRIVVDKEIADKQVKTTNNDILTVDMSENKPSKNSCSESISELKYSDDFTSPCYSDDFCATEDTSRISQAHDSSLGAENPKHSQYTSKSSETRLSIRKNNSEKSSILSPPFSAGSPVHSYKRSHISKTQDKSLEEASNISTSDLSSSHWTEEKENQIDQNSMHNSKVIKRGQDISVKLKTRTGCNSLEKSQSPRTSQVSSYLPSNLSELELNVLERSTSDHLEEDSDEVCSLNISKQCKDICELVINKLPGYTV